MKRTLLLCFFILSGILLGAMIASLAAGTPGLSWLAFSQSIGFHPVLDLSVIKLDLNFHHGHQRGPDHHHQPGHFRLHPHPHLK